MMTSHVDTAAIETPDQHIHPAVATTTLAGLTSLLSACGGGGDEAAVQRMQSEAPKEAPTPFLGQRAQPQASTTTTQLPTADELFVWAERSYPALFANGSSTQTSGSLKFRAYANNTYLGVDGTEVLGLGPFTQNQVLRLGHLADFPDAAVSTSAPTDHKAAQFLQRAQFSSLPAEISGLKALGHAAWLEQQMNAPRSQTAVDWMVAQGYDTINGNSRYYDSATIGERALWNRLLLAADQVRQRCALALSEFFCTTNDGAGTLPWLRNFGMADYWDQLCTHTFGNYRTLLEVVTLHPLMGVNLNTHNNKKENDKGRVPDENYAREVMQLFSIGLHQLNLDGSARTNTQGQKQETYTNADVINLARVFTGYRVNHSNDLTLTLVVPSDLGRRVHDRRLATRPMLFDSNDHSLLEKRFLGTTISANTSGQDSLRLALDTLFNHPNVGPFLGRQMIQRLVTSNPSPAYVARVATAFNNNGAGVRGDLKALFRAILLDEEALNASGSATFGRLRPPMVRFVHWARTVASETVRANWRVDGMENREFMLGQCPLRAPSVFNFYRPGYVPPATRTGAAGLVAPEFQIVNETTVSSYVNVMETLIRKGVRKQLSDNVFSTGTYVNPGTEQVLADFSNEMGLANDNAALIDHLNLVLCGGRLSDATRGAIARALTAVRWSKEDLQWWPDVTSLAQKKVHLAVFMVMISADYLIQK